MFIIKYNVDNITNIIDITFVENPQNITSINHIIKLTIKSFIYFVGI